MSEHDIEQFIRLEREVWEALANGDGEADGRLLSDDFLGVYTVGFADRAAHVAQLADGPTVSEFSLGEARLMVLADDMVLLAYRAQFTRPGEDAAGVGADQLDLVRTRSADGSTSSARTHHRLTQLHSS